MSSPAETTPEISPKINEIFLTGRHLPFRNYGHITQTSALPPHLSSYFRMILHPRGKVNRSDESGLGDESGNFGQLYGLRPPLCAEFEDFQLPWRDFQLGEALLVPSERPYGLHCHILTISSLPANKCHT